MRTKVKKKELTEEEIIARGWDALIQELGVAGATRFVMLIERGKGDSVQDFRQMWRGMSLDDIHRQLMKDEAQGVEP